MARFITLDSEKNIVGIRFAEKIVENEIESEIGELGQIMNEDGTFSDVIMKQLEPQPTFEQVAQSTLLETQYQTVLIEMLAGF